ncbi:hypothetical protein ACFLU6_11090 [Acidobacteriota bacterium]
MIRKSILIVFILLLAVSGLEAQANTQPIEDEGWPRQVEWENTNFTLHQPQIESWDGFQLEGYMAVAVEEDDESNPVFGAVWLSASTHVDKENRVALLHDFKIPRVNFPSSPERANLYHQVLQEKVIRKTKTMALDRLESSLEIVKTEKKTRKLNLKHQPPRIIFSEVPAMLIFIDGTPTYSIGVCLSFSLSCGSSSGFTGQGRPFSMTFFRMLQ